MAELPPLKLYNTLTRTKELFAPLDAANVRLYVCGPTVYDFAHIGNARPIIVFDILFRLLRLKYGQEHVTYARNITDVDDKINARALERGISIRTLTEATAAQFHADIARLGVLAPSIEPRATDHIGEMRTMIERLVAKGHAYVAEEHVLFDVTTMADYGRLANRTLEEMEAGSRVEVAPYKKGPMDFVLWKPSKAGEPSWPAPAGITAPGRPGWHIECSAMADKHLGAEFDIHGGGIDLMFPHHENEIAQSRCAHGTSRMASVFMHNGFLQVEGEKMAKSAGNFVTINELLDTDRFGGQRWHGRVVRLAMLGTHYRQPIDWTVERLAQAKATLCELADLLAGGPAPAPTEVCEPHPPPSAKPHPPPPAEPHADVLAQLSDDLNTPSALSIIAGLSKSARRGNGEVLASLRATLVLLGLYDGETRAELSLSRAAKIDGVKVDSLIAARLAARKARDFKAADRIRDELAGLGVTLKDAKDPTSGEIVTTWEPAR